MSLTAVSQTNNEIKDEPLMGTKHPYRCQCGQVLFKAHRKPLGLQIKCPRCKKLVDF